MEIIPFAPFPINTLKKMSEPFEGMGYRLSKISPHLGKDLSTSGMKLSAQEYGSIMAFSFFFYTAVFSVLMVAVLSKFVTTSSRIGTLSIPHYIVVGICIGIMVGFLVVVQMIAYPKIRTKKRVRDIEKNLVFALRTILVQLKSRVSLFDSLYMIASTNRYGQLSVEMKKAVDKINTGIDEEDALQELAVNNPSPYLRKALWQIVNGMKAGADVSDILTESVSSMTREQQIEIENYGNSLKILSLVYLMLGVIIPALGLTFLIVIGSFPKMKISEFMFWGLLGAILLAQFMFVGLMKSKRPNLMSD